MKPHPRPPSIRKTVKWGGASLLVMLVLTACEHRDVACTNCAKLVAARTKTGLVPLTPDLVRQVGTPPGKEIWVNPRVHYEIASEQGFYQKTQEYSGTILLYEEDEYISSQTAKHPDPDVVNPERVKAVLRVWFTKDGDVDKVEAAIEPTRGRLGAHDVLEEVASWK